MKTVSAGGMEYGPEEIKALREELSTLRDEALKQGSMGWTIILSHTIGLLAEMAKLLESLDG